MLINLWSPHVYLYTNVHTDVTHTHTHNFNSPGPTMTQIPAFDIIFLLTTKNLTIL